MSNEPENQSYYRLEIAARMVGMSPARVRHYVRLGMLPGQPASRERARFGESDLARLRKIRRLTVDLGLNPAGVEVALRLLDEVAALRAELDRLQRS